MQSAEDQRENTLKHKLAGLCLWCTEKAAEGRALCENHTRQTRETPGIQARRLLRRRPEFGDLIVEAWVDGATQAQIASNMGFSKALVAAILREKRLQSACCEFCNRSFEPSSTCSEACRVALIRQTAQSQALRILPADEPVST